MIKNVLFDMDGTLLPMDQDEFTNVYMNILAQTFSAHGYEPQKLCGAIWDGFKQMVMNQSHKTNETVFYESFRQIYGAETDILKPLFDQFYQNEFQQVKQVCGFDKKAADSVNKLKEMGMNVVIATLPAFPEEAIYSRIRWAGLNPDDFMYITTYENSTRCKPNPQYYSEIADKLQFIPSECIMVGNNVDEDMIAESIGMNVFLIPDCLINERGKDISVYQQGNFEDLVSYIKKENCRS